MEDTFALLDTVVAMVDVPDQQVQSGDLGAVVEIYREPTPAYDVEFVNPDGSTRALVTLKANQIRRLSASDVITTRPLSIVV